MNEASLPFQMHCIWKSLVMAVVLLIFSWPEPAAALEILSLSPTDAQPGENVLLTGGPFLAGATVRLGTETVLPSRIGERELTFTVPPLPQGDYVLAVVQDQVRADRTFILRVAERPPIIFSLDPPVLDECSGSDSAQIVVDGENFPPGANLFLDGQPAPGRRESSSRLILFLPRLSGGSHQLQVVTPRELKSQPRAFYIDDRPEILSAVPGEDRVNSYDVIIHGNNFHFQTSLVVDGKTVPRSGPLPAHTGRFRYQDCRTLIYERYPYSRTPRPITLQVVNPNARGSNVFTISLP
ncbi:MAG: hypothetical protein JXB25_06955 [Deltaproteobacteria bacterium]|nr:hypothetical protein [Deltaproteobacteria bacterium]